MKIQGKTHVLVQMPDGELKIIRTIYLQTVRKTTDPNTIHSHLSISTRLRRTQHTISVVTTPSATIRNYQKYPDSAQWRDAYKKALKSWRKKCKYHGFQRGAGQIPDRSR